MRSCLLLAVAASALAQTPSPTPNPPANQNVCLWQPDNVPGITFNVCNLASAQDYVWNDPTDAETTNSTYVFNIATNVQNVPPSCTAQNVPLAPAYQITNNGGGASCVYLGQDFTKRPVIASNQLYDTKNPAKGFIMTYSAGDSTGCASIPGQTVSRSFSLVFRCGPNFQFPSPGPTPPANGTFVNEEYSCEYTAYAWSTYGCPLECPIVNNQVCGGNGVCGYDGTVQKARCFCYSDWIESDCQTPRSPFPSGAVAGAVIGGIILGAAGLLAFAWWAGRSGAKAAPSAAGSLNAGDGFYPSS